MKVSDENLYYVTRSQIDNKQYKLIINCIMQYKQHCLKWLHFQKSARCHYVLHPFPLFDKLTTTPTK